MNILVLTTLYRDPEDTKDASTSPIVQNFAKEWVKSGHNVLLIHNFNTFLLPFYFIPRKVLEKVFNRVGFRIIPNLKQRKLYHYDNEGVNVYRLPILKIIPRGSYSKARLKKQFNSMINILKSNSFVPDIVVAHAENPQVYQLYALKQVFPKTKTCFVFHGVKYLGRPEFKEWKEEYLPTIDVFGFRSRNVLREAQEKINFDKEYFMCPSGISNEYVLQEITRPCNKVRKIIYVGTLIERKHLRTVIEALGRYPEREYELTVIGIGAQREENERLARRLKLKTSFLGKIPHEDVIKEMGRSDCFIMVSENEVFGLVYLEAMAQGCITVASEIGGMEGIIDHGENGFLSHAGDTDALCAVLDRIDQLEPSEIKRIRENGLLTAQQYSETKVAAAYLANIIE